jgi:hypothetical protein
MSNTQHTERSAIVPRASGFVFLILRVIFTPALYLLYRFKFDRESAKHIQLPCFILANHQTVFDQFALGMGFRFGINFVASDTIFRHGLLSRLMVALTHPIPISKGKSDMSAIRNMMSVIRDGGCVALFPSGNRSFFGDESTIAPGIGKLAKKLKAPLVLVQMRGGFNTKARWSAAVNKGKMSAHVTRVVTTEELATLSGDEIEDIIRKEICFNEYDYNQKAQIPYKGRRKAEYLESALFYCPSCSRMDSLESQGNTFFCRSCGTQAVINDYGFLEGAEPQQSEKTSLQASPQGTIQSARRASFPDTILEWSRLQLSFIKGFDFSPFADTPVFADDNVTLLQAQRARREDKLGTGRIELFADRLTVCGHSFQLADITTAIHGVRKMSIYTSDGVYAVTVPERTNLVKYMICGYHLRNTILGTGEEYYGY